LLFIILLITFIHLNYKIQNNYYKLKYFLQGRLLAAKPHSADVERLISYYNVLKTSGRSSLSPNTIKDCLYVKLNMPSVSEYNPKEAVLLWLNEKQRHSKVHEKATNQEWYQGVFPEAKADRLKQLTDDYNKCYSF